MIFIDESGSITRSSYFKKRYFVISVIETDEPFKVRRFFRKSKKNYIKHHPSLSNLDITKEIKGSEMPLKMKEYVIKELIEHTDVKFNFIVGSYVKKMDQK